MTALGGGVKVACMDMGDFWQPVDINHRILPQLVGMGDIQRKAWVVTMTISQFSIATLISEVTHSKQLKPLRPAESVSPRLYQTYGVISSHAGLTSRTYALRPCEASVDILAIQQNLGHTNLRNTEGCICTLDDENR